MNDNIDKKELANLNILYANNFYPGHIIEEDEAGFNIPYQGEDILINILNKGKLATYNKKNYHNYTTPYPVVIELANDGGGRMSSGFYNPNIKRKYRIFSHNFIYLVSKSLKDPNDNALLQLDMNKETENNVRNIGTHDLIFLYRDNGILYFDFDKNFLPDKDDFFFINKVFQGYNNLYYNINIKLKDIIHNLSSNPSIVGIQWYHELDSDETPNDGPGYANMENLDKIFSKIYYITERDLKNCGSDNCYLENDHTEHWKILHLQQEKKKNQDDKILKEKNKFKIINIILIILISILLILIIYFYRK